MKFTEAAIYKHFKGKTAVLESVLNYYKSDLEGKMKVIAEDDSNGLEKLSSIMQFQFKHFSDNPAIVMTIFAETSFQYDKVLSETVLRILTKKKQVVEKIIQIGQGDGSIRSDIEATYLASVFMGSIRFTILRWRLNDYNFDLIKEGENMQEANEKLMYCKIG